MEFEQTPVLELDRIRSNSLYRFGFLSKSGSQRSLEYSWGYTLPPSAIDLSVIAAAPDAWDHTAKDTKFNSGVLLLRPSDAEYQLLLRALATPGMHLPEEGDQPFLNRFYEYRYFGLPQGYNLNLVLYKWFPMVWGFLWPRAKIVHFTVRKPGRPGEWCVGACPEKGALEWYGDVFQEMLEKYGYVGKL
jgi:hypothetical protein